MYRTKFRHYAHQLMPEYLNTILSDVKQRRQNILSSFKTSNNYYYQYIIPLFYYNLCYKLPCFLFIYILNNFVKPYNIQII